MVYDLSTLANNTTGMLSLTQNANSLLLDGYFGTLILIGVTVIIFMSFFYFTGEADKTLAATGFVCFIIALLMRGLDLVPNKVLFITLMFAAVSVAFLWKK